MKKNLSNIYSKLLFTSSDWLLMRISFNLDIQCFMFISEINKFLNKNIKKFYYVPMYLHMYVQKSIQQAVYLAVYVLIHNYVIY